MEDVLGVYSRPYNSSFPVVCLDETSKQLIEETRTPIPMKPGSPARYDTEYRRNGTVNMFMMFEPLAAWRHVKITERRTRVDFAQCVRELLDERYPGAEKVVLVMDNLNTHSIGSLYEAFEPEEALRLAERLEIHHTPKHGSWLDMAEIEISVLSRQVLQDRIGDAATMTKRIAAWESARNASNSTVDWQFTTADARIKLKRLYPKII